MKKNLVENTPRLTTNIVSNLGLTEMESIVIENQKVNLTTTKCNFGGKRYWFTCPRCTSRVGTLFCPFGEDLYECRVCKGLRYELSILRRSKNEHYIKFLHQIKSL